MNELAWRHAAGDRQSARHYDLWEKRASIFFPLRQPGSAREVKRKKYIYIYICVAAPPPRPRLPMHARRENLLIFIHPRGGRRSIYICEKKERAVGALTRRHSRARLNLMDTREILRPIAAKLIKSLLLIYLPLREWEREREERGIKLTSALRPCRARALIRPDFDRVPAAAAPLGILLLAPTSYCAACHPGNNQKLANCH